MANQLGERISALRQKRKMSSGSLAEAVGIDASAMSKIESGNRKVNSTELLSISQALRISPTALLDPDSFAAQAMIAGRVLEGQVCESPMLQFAQWLTEMQPIVGPLRGVEPLAMRELDVDLTSMSSSQIFTTASELAQNVNTLFGKWQGSGDKLQALKQSIEVHLNADVVFFATEESDVLGLTIPAESFPVIVVNASLYRPRALFTLAHELGHLLSATGFTAMVDSDLKSNSPAERFANAFAAELLLPQLFIEEILEESEGNSQDSLEELLNRSGVSLQTLVYRLHNLGYLRATDRDQILGGWHLATVQDHARVAPSPGKYLSAAALRAAREYALGPRAAAADSPQIVEIVNPTERKVNHEQDLQPA